MLDTLCARRVMLGDRLSLIMADHMNDATTSPTMGLTTVDKLRLLLEVTKKISRSLDLQEVLRLVMDTLDSLIPYDAAGIYVLECDRHENRTNEDQDGVKVFHAEAVRGYDTDEMMLLRDSFPDARLLARRSSFPVFLTA